MKEFLETLSTPGAVGLSLLWIHHRLNHVEACLTTIAEVRGITLPKRRKWKSVLPISLVVATFGLGCAHVSQSVTSADGSKTESRVLALWPATSALDKASVRQTKTTQAIGIEGAQAEGGGTNVAGALSELHGILKIVSRP